MKILAENKQHLKRVLFACFHTFTLRVLSILTELPVGNGKGGL
jgi:hypothetical protein